MANWITKTQLTSAAQQSPPCQLGAISVLVQKLELPLTIIGVLKKILSS